MFKAARWKSEKNRIKATFKLQFRATQVPKLGWDSLLVSLVPLETGKPTAKTEKSVVHNGICSWEDPIYETVKLSREPKTGRFEDKIYQFLVLTGSSKAGFVGKFSINFADYSEAFKPSSVSLPLKTSNSSTVLHVTIQRLPTAVDGREAEEDEDPTERSHGRTLKSKLSERDTDESSKPSNLSKNSQANEDSSFTTRIAQMSLPLNKTVPQHTESNGNLRASNCFDDVSASSSDSSTGRDSPLEVGLSNNIHQDAISFLSPLSSNATLQKSSERSPEDSTNGSSETNSNGRLQASETSVEKLKNEIEVLARQAEVSELEIQTLRKQIVKESKRGQELSREIFSLKEGKDSLRKECEQLRTSQRNIVDGRFSSKSRFDSNSQRQVLEEIKEELNYEKDLNANLRLQLQKTQESNSELILAIRDLDELLEQKNKESSCISCNQVFVKLETNENGQELSPRIAGSRISRTKSYQEVEETVSEYETEEDEEQHALEELVKQHDDAIVLGSLEQKIKDLYSELEMYRNERDNLEMQMEQLALDYEILKQENHEISSKLEQNQLQEQLEMQYECSVSLSIVNDLETHVERLEEELEKQAETFESDLAVLTRAKVEQEQRAIQAEEALRKTRWNNANTAEKLQEEFKRLSKQMSSTFDANEKQAMQALTEASELRQQKSHLEDLFEKANEELGFVKDQSEAKLLQLSNQLDSKSKQIDQLLSELDYVSKELQNQKQSEEARQKAFSAEIAMLKNEIELLVRDKNSLSEQSKEQLKLRCEIEQMKIMIKERELLLERGKLERYELGREVSMAREEVGKLLEELNDTRRLKDEKESMVGIVQSEVETLKAQYNELKHSLFEDELEKENLRKQVFHLRGDLRRKEDAITVIEKKLRDNSSPKVTNSDGTTKPTLKNGSKSGSSHRGLKDGSNLQEKIKLLEGELKLKEAALENSKHSYLKKEKDLRVRIEELEKVIMEISQKDPSSCEEKFQILDVQTNSFRSQDGEVLDDDKENFANSELQGVLQSQEARDEQNKDSIGETPKDRSIDKNLPENEPNAVAGMPEQNGTNREPINSSMATDAVGNLVELISEMELLKRKNKSMEDELKEMQERYSKISLKFAEVEGERQQLVMTIRNLKNSKKN